MQIHSFFVADTDAATLLQLRGGRIDDEIYSRIFGMSADADTDKCFSNKFGNAFGQMVRGGQPPRLCIHKKNTTKNRENEKMRKEKTKSRVFFYSPF